MRKSEGDILGTELMECTRHHEHEPSLKEWTDQQPHIYINEEEFDETVLLKLMNNSPILNTGNHSS